jgi:SAM-dependent methyltransferase
MTHGWDDARTVNAYEAFGDRHARYRIANEVLVAHARLSSGHRVLDVGAGLGGTAEAALPTLGPTGRIVCVEPAAAMRERGRERVADPRVEWRESVPRGPFDRILSGAAIWQMLPLPETIADLAAQLRPEGALAFNVPSAYLGRADEPGGGEDPWLTALAEVLTREVSPADAEPGALPDADAVEAHLRSTGLTIERWEFRVRFTQPMLRDWMKIPPISDRLLASVPIEERSARIDRAYRQVDADSWRWERWTGFTAWHSG